MSCANCDIELHWECKNIVDGACCCSRSSRPDDLIEDERDKNEPLVSRRNKPRRGKRDSTLKDQQSTGRKRAAIAYPLMVSEPCEWQLLRYAGGGRNPIIGCKNGLQQARHHGPDKNTLNNDVGNVHRICHKCHNRWHSKNDSQYDPNIDAIIKHDPDTKATLEEILDNEIYYVMNKPKHVKGA